MATNNNDNNPPNNDGEATESNASGRRGYLPPAIATEATFETTALSCSYNGGSSFLCNSDPGS